MTVKIITSELCFRARMQWGWWYAEGNSSQNEFLAKAEAHFKSRRTTIDGTVELL